LASRDLVSCRIWHSGRGINHLACPSRTGQFESTVQSLIPIDVFHFQLFPKPTLLASVLGGVMLLIGFGIILATLFQNAFAAPIVEDQTEEGQVVIDTGLYGLVRHPMYLGFIPYFTGLALWLESYVGALSVLLIVGTLIARVFIEEKTLQENLPGYPEYMEKIRYRLIPFIW